MSPEISKINDIKVSCKNKQQLAKTTKEQDIALWQKNKETNNYDKLPYRPEEFTKGMEYLETSINKSINNYLGYEKGILGRTANGFKEIFGMDLAQSKVDSILLEEKTNIEILSSQAKHHPVVFRASFKEKRGVDFNIQNIKEFESKKEEFALISTFNAIKNSFDNKLENSLRKYEMFKDRKRPTGGHARISYDNVVDSLKNNLKEGLKAIYQDDKAVENHINKMSTELGIDLKKKMTKQEELQAWGKLAKTSSEHINNSFNKITQGKSIEEHQEEYQNLYKKAYGNTNAKEISDAFLQSQQTGEQIAKVAIVISTTIGTMGMATVINGAALGTKSAFALSTLTPGVTTTTTSILDDLTKDGKIDNLKEHLIEGAKISGYSAIGFGAGITSQHFIKGTSFAAKYLRMSTEFKIDVFTSTAYGKLVGDDVNLKENFLYTAAFMIPGVIGSRMKSKPQIEPPVKASTKEPLVLTELTQTSLDNFKKYSNIIKGKGNVELDKAVNEIKNVLPENMKSGLKARPKGVCSTYEKLVSDAGRKDITDLKSSIEAVDDLIGTRLILKDTNPKEIDKLVNSLEKSILKGDIEITELRNYRGRNGCEYFSDKQIERLSVATQKRFEKSGQGPKYLITKNAYKEIKESGYTTTQMKITHKKGKMGESVLGEFQIRGEHINKFADVEHIPYDLRTDKDLSKGNAELKKVYEPIETAIKRLDKNQYAEYNEYLSALYKYYRNIENGAPLAPITVQPAVSKVYNHYPAGQKPELPKGFNPILSEKGLHEIHTTAIKKQKELGIN